MARNGRARSAAFLKDPFKRAEQVEERGRSVQGVIKGAEGRRRLHETWSMESRRVKETVQPGP